MPRIFFNFLLFSFFVVVALTLGSCGGGGGSSKTTGPGGGTPPDSDAITMSVNGGPASIYNEASGLPSIDCDPRVDWGFDQVILWDNFTGGSGPNGYELFFEIMFPAADSVGTYTVQGDFLQALYYDGRNYSASPLLNTSSGTVQVTRSDSRIEGTYNLTVVDAGETVSLNLSGDFSVDAGFSLSCP